MLFDRVRLIISSLESFFCWPVAAKLRRNSNITWALKLTLSKLSTHHGYLSTSPGARRALVDHGSTSFLWGQNGLGGGLWTARAGVGRGRRHRGKSPSQPRACLLEVHPPNILEVVQKSAGHHAYARTAPQHQQSLLRRGLEKEQGLREGEKHHLPVAEKTVLTEIYF